MRVVIEQFQRRNLPDDWFDNAAPLYGIAAKIIDGDSDKKFKDQAKQIFAEADKANINKMGWGYHYARSINEATKEGTAAGKLANNYGIELYYFNCEKHWAGVWGEPLVNYPDKNASQFIDSFRREAPSCQVAWNGFSAENSGPRKLATKEVVSKCDVWSPMTYSSLTQNSSAVKRTVKWKEKVPHLAVSPVVDVKADYESIRKFIDYTKPDFLTVWLGNGGKDYYNPLMGFIKTLP